MTSRSLISASTADDRLPSGKTSQSTFPVEVEAKADASRRIGNLIPPTGRHRMMAASGHFDGVSGCQLVSKLGGLGQSQVLAVQSLSARAKQPYALNHANERKRDANRKERRMKEREVQTRQKNEQGDRVRGKVQKVGKWICPSSGCHCCVRPLSSE